MITQAHPALEHLELRLWSLEHGSMEVYKLKFVVLLHRSNTCF